MSPVSALPPTWLDQVIETVIDKNDPKIIAQVIANSPQIVDAIKRGLANKPQPGIMGSSHAQNIAREVRDVVAAL